MILICGDTAPTVTNQALFTVGNLEALLGTELAELFAKADFRIVNLETPLAKCETPIRKCGPNLIAPIETVKALEKMKINAVCLANNHIMDHGIVGLQQTMEVLKQSGIYAVGAGNNICEAQKPLYFTYQGKVIGLFTCAEHEFSIADESHAGANPFDPLDTPDMIAQIKRKCDYLIVLYHGGKEHYRYPSPGLQKTCRKIVEKGADIVICQHSHCIGCEEEYMNSRIIYGQGNFLFDMQDNEYWATGLVIAINDDFSIDYYPIVRNGNGIVLADSETQNRILEQYNERSLEISKPGYINKKYVEFAEKSIDNYLAHFSGFRKTILYRILNKLSNYHLEKHRLESYLRRNELVLRNFIECEAHRELLLEGLREHIK